MKYLEFTYVDTVTGAPVTKAPATNGPAMPDVLGLSFEFALETEYPTRVPRLFGTAADGADPTAPGVLNVLTQEQYNQIHSAEMVTRAEREYLGTLASIADRRYRAEIAGIEFAGYTVATDRTAQSLVTGAAVAAMLDDNYSVQWKSADGFVRLTAEQIIAMASAIRAHVQACFDREAELIEAVNDGTFTDEMLDEGWG